MHTEDETSQESTVEALANNINDQSFKCELCDLESNRKNGLLIHMSHRHKTIEQLDGAADDVPNSDDEEDIYMKALKSFGKQGILGPVSRLTWIPCLL